MVQQVVILNEPVIFRRKGCTILRIWFNAIADLKGNLLPLFFLLLGFMLAFPIRVVVVGLLDVPFKLVRSIFLYWLSKLNPFSYSSDKRQRKIGWREGEGSKKPPPSSSKQIAQHPVTSLCCTWENPSLTQGCGSHFMLHILYYDPWVRTWDVNNAIVFKLAVVSLQQSWPRFSKYATLPEHCRALSQLEKTSLSFVYFKYINSQVPIGCSSCEHFLLFTNRLYVVPCWFTVE